MKEILLKKNEEGVFDCTLDISVEEWVDILLKPSVTKPTFKQTLIALYKEKQHRATCTALGEKHGNEEGKDPVGAFSSRIQNFGQAVVKYLNRFSIVRDNGKNAFWPVPCKGRYLIDGKFELIMRPELVLAIEQLGWNAQFTWIPFYEELADKLLNYMDNRQALIEIVYSLDSKFVSHIRDIDGNKTADIDPFTFFGIFNRGITDENRIEILRHIKDRMGIKAELPKDFDSIPLVNLQKSTFYFRDNLTTDIQPLWELFASMLCEDNKALEHWFNLTQKQHGIKWNITMGMYWMRPYTFIALDANNRTYLPSLGIEVFDEKNLNYANYIELCEKVRNIVGSTEVEDNNIPEISYSAWTQDEPKYWLVGGAFSGTDSQLEQFFSEGVWYGCFSKTKGKKQISDAKSLKAGDVIIIKSTYTKGKNREKSIIKVKAVGIITEAAAPVEEKEDEILYKCKVDYISFAEKEFEKAGSGWKTIQLATTSNQPIIDYVNQILGTPKEDITTKGKAAMPSKYQKYINILKECHNLVLTGAPGTGKTFMAHEIAKAMGAEVEFVQFHPSYDYTDFVEGLRPVEKGDNQMGFERKDGIFKTFCADAIDNMEASAKSATQQAAEQTWKEKLDQFVTDAIENGTLLKTATNSEFSIVEQKTKHIVVENTSNLKKSLITVPYKEVIELLNEKADFKNVGDIRDFFQRKWRTQFDSYTYAIVREVRKITTDFHRLTIAPTPAVQLKPYVFIIDEINRGEASKIFGELFYAIDPGYRGEKEKRVKTQYQNLVPVGDTFEDGFYVPENVFILATMNDIDRSVESMDFAMRRRFTWLEVTPDDTKDMLDSLDDVYKDIAVNRMTSLNTAIAGTEGLGAAFMIGPSYFLKLKQYHGDFEKLWDMNICPLLREYLRGFKKANETLTKLRLAYNTASTSVVDTSDIATGDTHEE